MRPLSILAPSPVDGSRYVRYPDGQIVYKVPNLPDHSMDELREPVDVEEEA
jgi:hypothetical protein